MRTSIATVCLSGTLEEKMRAAASAGFDGIEVFEPDLVVSPSSPEQLRELAAELGLSLDMYQPSPTAWRWPRRCSRTPCADCAPSANS
ncbi:hypothetical protein [Kocuria marina]|uniref:hypothetical protein n=1 Tax=Kocuria marina TaxID=223184 RepID=UPI003F27CE51